MRSRWFPLAAMGAWATLALSGCAYSLISRGEIRPQSFEDLVHRTALVRGIQPEWPIDARVVKRAELDEILTRALREQWSLSELQRYQQALNAVGLWPSNRSLLDEYLGVMGEEIAGVYLASERALYLVADARTPFWIRVVSALARRDLFREIVLSHELVHLLQHQAYPQLLDPDPFYKDHDDLGFAVQAAFEGDAMLYGFLATGLGVNPPPEDIKKSIEAEAKPRSRGRRPDVPALIHLTLTFPYAEGYRLAYHEGQGLLERPPASTEQVLHAEKRREDFLALDVQPLAARLPSQCRLLHSNTMGELELSVLFRDLGKEVPNRAWEGWDGDRYLAADCDGRSEFLWITAWDSEQDAAEFESAYAGIAGAVAERGALAAPPEIERMQKEVYVVTSGLAELREALPRLPRRRRVSDVEALRECFEAATPSSGDGVEN